MIYGEITQKLSLYLFPRQLKKWPRETAEKYGGWFLYGLFVLIFLWEELWNLENTAYLSSCLLLLITAGAMIFSTIFERRFWCRYLCPIGGMNGMFAKLSMTELRAQQGICSAECSTYQCYKGGPQKGEGKETDGCPLYSHPAQLEDNRDCVLCMTCLKACPHRSVEFNLRPPAIELWTTHTPRSYEVALLLLLLGAIFLHHLPAIITQLDLPVNLTDFGQHTGIAIAVLFLPSVVPFLAHAWLPLIFKVFSSLKPRSFVELAYGYLPLVLMGNLAHYLQLGLGEAGKILPVTMATFGLTGMNLPLFIAHPAVIAFLQGTALVIGVLSSIYLTRKIAKQPFPLLIPHYVGAIVLGLGIRSIL
jgi:polyferredoxin